MPEARNASLAVVLRLGSLVPAVWRNLVQNIDGALWYRREPSEFDQSLVFRSINMAGRVFGTALRNEFAKQHYVIISGHGLVTWEKDSFTRSNA